MILASGLDHECVKLPRRVFVKSESNEGDFIHKVSQTRVYNLASLDKRKLMACQFLNFCVHTTTVLLPPTHPKSYEQASKHTRVRA